MNQSDVNQTVNSMIIAFQDRPIETVIILMFAVAGILYALQLLLGPMISNTIKGILGFALQIIGFGLKLIATLLKSSFNLLKEHLEKKERGRR